MHLVAKTVAGVECHCDSAGDGYYERSSDISRTSRKDLHLRRSGSWDWARPSCANIRTCSRWRDALVRRRASREHLLCKWLV